MNPVQCIMGRPMERDNKQDQAPTPASQRTAFQRSSSRPASARVRSPNETKSRPGRTAGRANARIFLLIRVMRRPGRQGKGLRATTPRSAAACISLLIRGLPARQWLRALTDRCRFRRIRRLPKPDRHCKSLQIVADTHAAAVGPSSATEAFLLREIAAAA